MVLLEVGGSGKRVAEAGNADLSQSAVIEVAR